MLFLNNSFTVLVSFQYKYQKAVQAGVIESPFSLQLRRTIEQFLKLLDPDDVHPDWAVWELPVKHRKVRS